MDEYLIKWEGYAVSESTWEPKQNLNCPQLLKDFHARNSATHVTSTEAKISLLFNLQDTLGGRIGQVERTSTNRIYLTFTNTSFKQKMVENRKRLAKWEKIINSASASQQRQISIVNDVDLMCL